MNFGENLLYLKTFNCAAGLGCQNCNVVTEFKEVQPLIEYRFFVISSNNSRSTNFKSKVFFHFREARTTCCWNRFS